MHMYGHEFERARGAGLASMRSAPHGSIFCCHRRLKVNLSSLSCELYRQTLLWASESLVERLHLQYTFDGNFEFVVAF